MADGTIKLILRFRDLNIGQGETLRRHRELSVQKSHPVWWGWWKKAGEQTPERAFSDLIETMPESGGYIPVWLFDSGRSTIHAAKCHDIEWCKNRQPMRSPDPALTPDYYSMQAYLVWLQLSDIQIEPTDESKLRGYSYLQVDELFSERKSRFSPFYGKQVSSAAELKQQERSIWFVRPYSSADPRHEISLLDPTQISPFNFPRHIATNARSRILWLSDLHFSIDGNHEFPVETTGTKRELSAALKEELDQTPIAGVIISGDLTWKAHKEEFSMTRKFLERLRSALGIGNYDILLCPGNHDISFSIDPSSSGIEAGPAPSQAKAAYEQLYSDLYYLNPNCYISCGRSVVLGNSVPVEIVALNSSYLEQQPREFQGHGFLGPDQLRHAAEQMGWTNGARPVRRPFRILVMHHHFVPVSYRDIPVVGGRNSVVYDAGALRQWVVENRIDLVLHGHMHEPFLAKMECPAVLKDDIDQMHTFHVAGMGSTGVASSHLGDEVKHNTYGLLEFQADCLILSIRRVDPVKPYGKAGTVWSVSIPYGRDS